MENFTVIKSGTQNAPAKFEDEQEALLKDVAEMSINHSEASLEKLTSERKTMLFDVFFSTVKVAKKQKSQYCAVLTCNAEKQKFLIQKETWQQLVIALSKFNLQYDKWTISEHLKIKGIGSKTEDYLKAAEAIFARESSLVLRMPAKPNNTLDHILPFATNVRKLEVINGTCPSLTKWIKAGVKPKHVKIFQTCVVQSVLEDLVSARSVEIMELISNTYEWPKLDENEKKMLKKTMDPRKTLIFTEKFFSHTALRHLSVSGCYMVCDPTVLFSVHLKTLHLDLTPQSDPSFIPVLKKLNFELEKGTFLGVTVHSYANATRLTELTIPANALSTAFAITLENLKLQVMTLVCPKDENEEVKSFVRFPVPVVILLVDHMKHLLECLKHDYPWDKLIVRSPSLYLSPLMRMQVGKQTSWECVHNEAKTHSATFEKKTVDPVPPQEKETVSRVREDQFRGNFSSLIN